MEKSRTSLRQWFVAIYLFSCPESSITAAGLSRIIEVTYKTAWLMLHKLRDALDHADNRTLLDGIVRVQGGAYGNPFNPYTEQDHRRHPLLAAGSIHESGAITDLRLSIMEPQHIQPNGHIRHVGEQTFIERHVSPAATEVHSVRYRQHMSRYHPLVRCIAEFNDWAGNSFHGLSRKYLQAYANEFCFRYNMRPHPQLSLYRLFNFCTHLHAPPTRRSLASKHQLSHTG